MESNIAQHSPMVESNIARPRMAPGINNISTADGWYIFRPSRPVVIYHDAPLNAMEDYDNCYVTLGNVKICLGALDNFMVPRQSNVSPCLTLTSVKMENHPEHIAVMFGQAISNLK
jgi:hypothetical protein